MNISTLFRGNFNSISNVMHWFTKPAGFTSMSPFARYAFIAAAIAERIAVPWGEHDDDILVGLLNAGLRIGDAADAMGRPESEAQRRRPVLRSRGLLINQRTIFGFTHHGAGTCRRCAVCHNDIAHLRIDAVYCGSACQNRGVRLKNRLGPQVAPCRMCNKLFQPKRSNQLYCSISCKNRKFTERHKQQ